jgi:hypothetical protein
MNLPTEKTKIKTIFENVNICLVGNPKVGKTTFASYLNSDGDSRVLFLATEKGHDFLEVFKVDIDTFKSFGSVMTSLLNEEHNFKTVVIDVVDRLYEYMEEEICKRNGVKTISDIPYGSGYSAVRKLFLQYFDSLNKKGISVVFITHAKEKEFRGENVSWTAMGTSLGKAIEESLLGMCDLVLYCYIDRSGKRMTRTKPNKFVICAGDRSNRLPEVMEMNPVKLLTYLHSEK